MKAPIHPSAVTSPLDLPRDQWPDHPSFPSQTLLLRSHEGFREISRFLVESAREGVDGVRLRWTLTAWQSGMRGHESYEEGKLFPYLSRRFGVSMEHLEAGHERLHSLRSELYAQLDALEAPGASAATERARERLVEAFEAYDACLREHLEEEEDTVIPMLLALEGWEFQRYLESPIRQLLAWLDQELPKTA